MTDIAPTRTPIPNEDEATMVTTSEEPQETPEPNESSESAKKESNETTPALLVSRKTWTAISPASSSACTENEPKASLLSIMAEEAEMSKKSEEKKREEDLMNQAIQQSFFISKEDEELQKALQLSMAMEETESQDFPSVDSAASTPAVAVAGLQEEGQGLSAEEIASIEQAIQQADDEEAQKSLQLAMQFQTEHDTMRKQVAARSKNQGNVRTVTREEYMLEQQGLLLKKDHGDMYADPENAAHAGYRINSQSESQWTRVDGSTILGPNNELRTKHDPELHSQANAHRLQLDFDEDGKPAARVGNKAFNSFKQTMKKKTVKGVAAHGQGRANADSEKTKEGALDGRVRLLVTKAINTELIEKFNGCVKEGKEARVYHADKGAESGGYDVAVKVFKRIQEFRNRGEYVAGDPRYDARDFSKSSGRVKLEIWAEKEYRNLIRAHRAGIPVPKPLHQKENVLFMRFLGQEGWPSPQLRELKMKKGSKKWTALYEQCMSAIQTLYNDAKLIHGDLSEYNILVCPSHLLQDQDQMETAQDPDALQIALIDFGQAVDSRHLDAEELLRRDLQRVMEFFDKMGISTIGLEAAMHYVKTKGAPLRHETQMLETK
jgi:serine/threonine-protein kinase RIO1